jgi:hypothetical protein
MSKAPVNVRIKLVTFLIQLLPHFPKWQGESNNRLYLVDTQISAVLSWDTITEALLEDDYEQRMGDGGDGPAAAHLVST